MSKSEASLSKSTNKSMSLSKVSSPRATDPKTRMRVARCRARSAMTSSRRSDSVCPGSPANKRSKRSSVSADGDFAPDS